MTSKEPFCAHVVTELSWLQEWEICSLGRNQPSPLIVLLFSSWSFCPQGINLQLLYPGAEQGWGTSCLNISVTPNWSTNSLGSIVWKMYYIRSLALIKISLSLSLRKKDMLETYSWDTLFILRQYCESGAPVNQNLKFNNHGSLSSSLDQWGNWESEDFTSLPVVTWLVGVRWNENSVILPHSLK